LSSLTGDYVQRKRRLRKGGANSAFSILRKELREGSLQSLLGGSSCFVSSSNTEPDPLLSPFIFNPPGFDEALNAKPLSSVEASSVKGSTTEEFLERYDYSHPFPIQVTAFDLNLLKEASVFWPPRYEIKACLFFLVNQFEFVSRFPDH